MRTKSVNRIFLNVATAHPYAFTSGFAHSLTPHLSVFYSVDPHRCGRRCFSRSACAGIALLKQRMKETQKNDQKMEAEKRVNKKERNKTSSNVYFFRIVLFRQHLLLSGCCSDSFVSPLVHFRIWFFDYSVSSFVASTSSSGFHLSFRCGLVFLCSCICVYGQQRARQETWLVKHDEKKVMSVRLWFSSFFHFFTTNSCVFLLIHFLPYSIEPNETHIVSYQKYFNSNANRGRRRKMGRGRITFHNIYSTLDDIIIFVLYSRKFDNDECASGAIAKRKTNSLIKDQVGIGLRMR